VDVELEVVDVVQFAAIAAVATEMALAVSVIGIFRLAKREHRTGRQERMSVCFHVFFIEKFAAFRAVSTRLLHVSLCL
jgi:hypothetical protein